MTTAQVDTLSKQVIISKHSREQQALGFDKGPQPWEETDYKRMLVSMVANFKRRSRSRGRQMTSQNHS